MGNGRLVLDETIALTGIHAYTFDNARREGELQTLRVSNGHDLVADFYCIGIPNLERRKPHGFDR